MAHMKSTLQGCCLLALCCLCPLLSWAQVWPENAINLVANNDGRPIATDVKYWPDPYGLKPEQVIEQGRFRAVGSDKFSFYAKKHWYSLPLSNPTSSAVHYFLATGLPSTPLLKAYWVDGDQVDEHFTSLASDPFTARPLVYPLLFIPVELPPYSSKKLLIEHKSLANYPLALRVVSAEVLQEKMSFFTLIRGIVFGALFVFFILFVAQACSTPSSALIYYCCYIAGLILLVGQVFGYNFTYLWPSFGNFNQLFTPVITGITYSFYYLFSAHLFNLREKFNALYCVTILLAVLAFLLAIANVVLDVFWLLAALALLGLPVPIVIAVWARRKQLTSANLFLAGSILHCSLSYLLALECLGVHLGYSYYLFSLLSAGQILDLGLFSTALLRQASHLRKALYDQLEQRVSDAETLASAEKERAMMLASRQAEALSLATATHDLNQPLAAIRFALALVDDQKNTGAKDHIVKTLNYTEELLKSMTKHGKDDYEHARQQVAAQQVFVQVQKRQSELFKQKGLAFRIHMGVAEFECMPVLLQRIVDNLLVNAARYTNRGGVLLSVRRRSGAILVQVWDTGSGMTPAQVERFKQPFTQENSQSLQGFGLGLFIVKTLAEKAGYSLSIRSELGRGTCVSVLLPQDAAKSDSL